MRILLTLFLILPLAAQDSSQKPPEAAAATAETKTEEKAAEAPAAPPAGEGWISGNIDFGYRWVQDPRGSADTYRSVVNLGSGPKLVGADVTLLDPHKKAFDRIDVSLHNWGGDPYNTLRVDARKQGLYNFLADYRNISYFNYLPSFANPFANQGSLMNQRSFDTQRRYTNLELDVLPGHWMTPYFSYTRDWGEGTGITPFVAEGNEYALPVGLRDKTDNFRGGVRFELNRFHLTLEQGGTHFSDDTSADYSQRNLGNRRTPLLGQTLFLNKLNQVYGVTGSSLYTRIMATGSPTRWLNFFGQFLFSEPDSNVTYSDSANGLFAVVSTLRFYNGQQDLVSSASNQPHTSGNVGFELRPLKRVRIVESLMTDRFHNASSALMTEQLLAAGSVAPETRKDFLTDRLVYRYNRNQVDGFVDVTSKLTLRGGYRYVWGDSEVRSSPLNPFTALESGEIRQHVGLAGINFRAGQKLSLNADYEGASSDKSYFRTSLRDYHQLRLRGRYQLLSTLSLAANFGLLDNQNPTKGIQFDMRQQNTSLSLHWAPKDGKRFTLLGDYTRSTLHSNIGFLDPTDFQSAMSQYRDRAHVATALADFNFPSVKDRTAKLSFGGSMFIASGSRPANYYQPIGRFMIPVVKKLQWFGEWRWYGYSQTLYLYEGFRSNHFLTGFRVTM